MSKTQNLCESTVPYQDSLLRRLTPAAEFLPVRLRRVKSATCEKILSTRFGLDKSRMSFDKKKEKRLNNIITAQTRIDELSTHVQNLRTEIEGNTVPDEWTEVVFAA